MVVVSQPTVMVEIHDLREGITPFQEMVDINICVNLASRRQPIIFSSRSVSIAYLTASL
jgi:hypothetical protein